MKTTQLRIVGSTTSLFGQRSIRMLRTMFGMLLVFSGLIDGIRALSANEIQALVTPPQVVITSPANGQTFLPGDVGPITADVINFFAPVTKVEFYEFSSLIGTATELPYSVVYDQSRPMFLLKGRHYIDAVATDTLGNVVRTDPGAFWFTICDDTYDVAYLKIISPANRSVFNYGEPILIQVMWHEPCDGLFDGIDLSMDGSFLVHQDGSTLDFVLENVPLGSHWIFARTTGSNTGFNDELYITVVDPWNQAPTVAITSPTDGAVFHLGADIPVHVTAQDSDGSVVQVQLTDGTTTFTTAATDFDYTFLSLAAGNYTLTATATDNGGATATSSIIRFSVVIPNVPPTVAITSPAEGAVFTAPANVPVHVTAQDSDGAVVLVELTDGSTTLGTPATDFDYTFLSLGPANYTLTATATDNFGAVGTTSVHITVGTAARPANDHFAHSFDLARITTGNNVNATSEPGEADHNPHGRPLAGHSVWWHWAAPGDGNVVLRTVGSSFDTVLAVYRGSSVYHLSLEGWNDNWNDSRVWSEVRFFARAGTTYHIAVDGVAGECGDIQLNIRYDSHRR